MVGAGISGSTRAAARAPRCRCEVHERGARAAGWPARRSSAASVRPRIAPPPSRGARPALSRDAPRAPFLSRPRRGFLVFGGRTCRIRERGDLLRALGPCHHLAWAGMVTRRRAAARRPLGSRRGPRRRRRRFERSAPIASASGLPGLHSRREKVWGRRVELSQTEEEAREQHAAARSLAERRRPRRERESRPSARAARSLRLSGRWRVVDHRFLEEQLAALGVTIAYGTPYAGARVATSAAGPPARTGRAPRATCGTSWRRPLEPAGSPRLPRAADRARLRARNVYSPDPRTGSVGLRAADYSPAPDAPANHPWGRVSGGAGGAGWTSRAARASSTARSRHAGVTPGVTPIERCRSTSPNVPALAPRLARGLARRDERIATRTLLAVRGRRSSPLQPGPRTQIAADAVEHAMSGVYCLRVRRAETYIDLRVRD